MAGINKNDIYEDCDIQRGTVLYRITSPAFSDKSFLLNGKEANRGWGRFTRPHQPTSYVSDNILLCVCEKLFHMCVSAHDKLANNCYKEFISEAHRHDLILVVFLIDDMQQIVNLESSVARNNYKLNTSTVTSPFVSSGVLLDAADDLRNNKKNGILYPSARHEKGSALCFFLDQTSKILSIEAKIRLKLTLLSEDLNLKVDDPGFDPVNHRISYTVGHFDFNPTDFMNNIGKSDPKFTNTVGKINFSRIHYFNQNYPDCSFC